MKDAVECFAGEFLCALQGLKRRIASIASMAIPGRLSEASHCRRLAACGCGACLVSSGLTAAPQSASALAQIAEPPADVKSKWDLRGSWRSERTPSCARTHGNRSSELPSVPKGKRLPGQLHVTWVPGAGRGPSSATTGSLRGSCSTSSPNSLYDSVNNMRTPFHSSIPTEPVLTLP